MTRLEKARFISSCMTATTLLRLVFDNFVREAKAKNGNAKRNARNEAREISFIFFSYIYQAKGSLPEALHMIADALEGKLRAPERVPYDKIERAVAAIFGGKNDVRYLTKAPFPFRRFKQELARIYGVTPKELTKKTQREKDREHSYELKEKPSGAQVFDSDLRQKLKRRGYKFSGKAGRPPRLPTE